MKKKLICILLAVFMAAVLLPVTALAATREIITTWTDLQSAVTEANDGDTITLSADIQTEATLTIGKALTLNLNGHKLDAKGGNFSVITVTTGGDLTLNDSIGTGEITGGFIYGNGGGVYVDSGSTFNMTGGTISGNRAPAGYGGGVYVSVGSTFNMTGGMISGNVAGFGGGVCNYGTMTMTGGVITGNTANDGCGVCFSYATVIFGGTAKIKENMWQTPKGKIPQNVYVGYDTAFFLGTDAKAPKDGMDIGVTMAYSTGRFTFNGTADDAQYFSADNSAYMVKYNEGGYLEVVENLQVGSVNITPDSQIDPNNIVDATISPATGITESNTELLVVIGMISFAVIGLGAALIVRRKEQ